MDYMSLFPSASRELPRFSALAEAVLSQVNDLIAVVAAFPAAFSVSGAVGEQLDDIGASFMLPRPEGLTDAQYREYLTARLAMFGWNGANDSAQELMTRLFPGSTISDNCNGTVNVHTVSELQAEQRLYPVPAGIQVAVS
ncbi:MAG: hypothetical protein IJK06_09120 [Clostridia bacterium]|nr:hypothetical protein [Clostridia bacterium]